MTEELFLEMYNVLKKAHKQLHQMCDMYCRDKDGFLKHEPGGWDAELDIEIQNILNRKYGTEQNSDAIGQGI